jgi:uncharacterized phage protein (TIGR02218 family)
MTTPRATQGAILAVGRGQAAARTTQGALLAIVPPAPTSRATQAALLAIAQPVPVARASQAAIVVVANQPVPCVTRWAQCWIIRREDGLVQGFTTLDSPLTVDGVICTPCNSFTSGAVELAAQIGSVGNQEVSGLIDSDAISAEDLHQGRYDNARVDLWLVPWTPDPSEPWLAVNDTVALPRRLAAGRMGQVQISDEGFKAEILTDGAALAQTALVSTYEPGCRWTQYDARCGLNRAVLEVTGSVTGLAGLSVYNRAAFRVFFDSARPEADGVFDGATMEWLTGLNAGLRSEVKTWEGKRFTLWDALPKPIAAGDSYRVAPACGNTPAGCKALGNYRRYGGFPDVPGNDEITKTPNFRG